MTAPTNDFVVFDPTSTNIDSQSTYVADTRKANGFTTGIVPSALCNKIWRQATALAAVIGQFIANSTGANVADDGTTATILTNLSNARKSFQGANLRPITSFGSTTTIAITSGGSGGIWLGTGITKSTAGSWVAGTGNGMGTGLTITASNWYYVFLANINGQPDVFFDSSQTGAHAPSGTTTMVRIGSFFVDGSTHIVSFIQVANRFIWSTPFNILNAVVVGSTSATTQTMPTEVPPIAGVEVEINSGGADGSQGVSCLVSPLSLPDVVPGAGGADSFTWIGSPPNTFGGVAQIFVAVNASSQVRLRMGTTTGAVYLNVNGYRDPFI